MNLSLEEKVKLLLESGISGDKVADKIGISKGTFYKLKSGKTDLDKTNFLTIKKMAFLYDELLKENTENVERGILEKDRAEYLEFISIVGNSDIIFNKKFEDENKQKAFEEVVKNSIRDIYTNQKLATDLFSFYKSTYKEKEIAAN